jgi:hypothetical protein
MFGQDRQRHCPPDGELRAALDGGFEAPLSTRLHVEQCAHCAARLAELNDGMQRAAGLLGRLEAGAPADTHIRVEALHRAAERRGVALTEGGSFMTGAWDRRLVRTATAGAALVAVMALLLVSPMRSVAGDLFNRFQVERFAAITVDADEFATFNTEMLLRFAGSDPQALMDAVDGLVTYESTFNFEDPMGNVTEVQSPEEAAAIFGAFAEPASVPDGFAPTPTYYVSEPGRIDVSLDTAGLQTLADELEVTLTALPDPAVQPTIDLTVEVPAGLVIEYDGATEEQELIVAQMPSPTLVTPDYLDMNQLRDDILRLPGLPSGFVDQMRAIDNWQSTLIVPVPEGYSSDDVTVDGEPGLLLEADQGDESVVLFEKNGMLYIVAGPLPSDVLLELAGSLE